MKSFIKNMYYNLMWKFWWSWNIPKKYKNDIEALLIIASAAFLSISFGVLILLIINSLVLT